MIGGWFSQEGTIHQGSRPPTWDIKIWSSFHWLARVNHNPIPSTWEWNWGGLLYGHDIEAKPIVRAWHRGL